MARINKTKSWFSQMSSGGKENKRKTFEKFDQEKKKHIIGMKGKLELQVLRPKTLCQNIKKLR